MDSWDERRGEDRGLDSLNQKVDKIKDEVTTLVAVTAMVQKNLKDHEEIDRDRMDKIHEKINKYGIEISEVRTNQINNTLILNQIAVKVGAHGEEQASVRNLPKLLTWITATIAAIVLLKDSLLSWLTKL